MHYAYLSLFDSQDYLAPVLSALLPHVPGVTLGIRVLRELRCHEPGGW
jgi:hypothetical protein